MAKLTQPIPFAGAELRQARHVCAFFNSEDEEYRVLLPFIKDGFDCGHKAVHVLSPDRRERHVDHLAAVGIDTAAAQDSGQLELRDSTETYLSTVGSTRTACSRHSRASPEDRLTGRIRSAGSFVRWNGPTVIRRAFTT